MDSTEIFGSGTNLRALVDELDEVFPPEAPTPSDSIEAIMYRSGERAVVNYIRRKLE